MTYNEAELDHIELWYRATGDDGSLPDKEFCISPDYITAIKVLNGAPLAEYERLKDENARLTAAHEAAADKLAAARELLKQMADCNPWNDSPDIPVVDYAAYTNAAKRFLENTTEDGE